ncbi:hypothetical protein F4805DRAFT_259611 [Annulohypoxylon moriforme]|nr:hypothetical protein F4805DRAFT_259611 [Annulohypoxylon moriforme]
MTVALAARVYIRYACFRRLLLEDYFMFFSLCIYIAIALVGTLYLQIFYDAIHLADGSFTPGPNFMKTTKYSLRAFAATSILTYIGLWLIKLNFLIFFYRLGHQLPKFRIFWWIVLFIVVASGAIQIGIIEYPCMLDDINTILLTCGTRSHLYKLRRRLIVSVTLDILSDILMICFPTSILWTSRVNIHQKLVFSGVFSLTGFAIAVTVVRGVSPNINDARGTADVNISVFFWLAVEYLACMFSPFEHRFFHVVSWH